MVTPDSDLEAVGSAVAVAVDLTALMDTIEGFATVDDVVKHLSCRLLAQYE